MMIFFFLDLSFPVREDPSQVMGYIIPMISYSPLALCFISRMNLPSFIFCQLIPAIFLVAECESY